MIWLYHILDYIFLVIHMAIVFLNLLGWIWKPLRKVCLVMQLLTAGSWLGLGMIYGIGFCPITEWHWQVLARLGEYPAETSYFQYLFRRFFDLHLRSALVDAITAISFSIAFLASVYANVRDWRHRKDSNY